MSGHSNLGMAQCCNSTSKNAGNQNTAYMDTILTSAPQNTHQTTYRVYHRGYKTGEFTPTNLSFARKRRTCTEHLKEEGDTLPAMGLKQKNAILGSTRPPQQQFEPRVGLSKTPINHAGGNKVPHKPEDTRQLQ